MLMFTSCGWFFDEISGLETNQILQYANRAIHYAMQIDDADIHEKFQQKLATAPSNIYENGAVSYQENVMPARVNLERVGMHFAAASLFEGRPEELELFNYVAESEILDRYHAGNQRLTLGRTTVRSRITHSEKRFSFAVLYLGQQNIIGSISTNMPQTDFDAMSKAIVDAFTIPDLGEVISIMQQYFGGKKYSIWHLFRDEKRKILDQIVQISLQKAENDFRVIYNVNYQLMTGIANSGMRIPGAYQSTVEFVLNRDLQAFFSKESSLNLREIQRLVSEFKKWDVKLTQRDFLHLRINEKIFQALSSLNPNDEEKGLRDLNELIGVLETLNNLDLTGEYWKSQNHYFYLLQKFEGDQWEGIAPQWKDAFLLLGELIWVKT